MTLDFASFSSVFAWVTAHGYFLIFLAMCLEGPMTTAAAGFAAALGFFNPWIILLLSILGDLIPDAIYYYMGYFGNTAAVNKFSKLWSGLGLTQQRVQKMEKLLHEHFGKTMIMLKLTPLLAAVGFMAVGSLRASFRKFIKISFLVTFPKSIIFLVIGYYFGHLYNVSEYVRYTGIFLPLLVALIFILYFGGKKISSMIVKKLGKL